MNLKTCSLWAVLVFGLLSTGCQTVHWSKGDWESTNYFKKKAKETKTEFGAPDAITAIWTDTVMENNSMPITRGFGGRLYFYDSERRPIKVDGELTIYGYDDTVAGSTHKNADHKYVFTKEDLQKHYSETKIGHSYSIWIPWDEVGGESKEISLVPIFVDSKNRTVKGQMNLNLLRGKAKNTANESTAGKTIDRDGSFVQYSSVAPDGKEVLPTGEQVVYVGKEPQESMSANGGIRTTTFDLPESGVIMKKSSVIATSPPISLNEMREALEKQAELSKTEAKQKTTAPQKLVETAADSSANSAPSATSARTSRSAFGRPGSLK